MTATEARELLEAAKWIARCVWSENAPESFVAKGSAIPEGWVQMLNEPYEFYNVWLDLAPFAHDDELNCRMIMPYLFNADDEQATDWVEFEVRRD